MKNRFKKFNNLKNKIADEFYHREANSKINYGDIIKHFRGYFSEIEKTGKRFGNRKWPVASKWRNSLQRVVRGVGYRQLKKISFLKTDGERWLIKQLPNRKLRQKLN